MFQFFLEIDVRIKNLSPRNKSILINIFILFLQRKSELCT